VNLSPFHYVALSESAVGAMGFKEFLKGATPLKRFFSQNWWDQASKSMQDVDGLAHRAKQGLEFRIPDQTVHRQGMDLIQRGLDWLENKGTGTRGEKGLKAFNEKFMKFQKFLFNEYHPRIKIATYDYYVERTAAEYIKEGKSLTPEAIDNIEKDTAKVVNNQFGGQIWETTPFLNNPQTMKWTRRAVGYPDWTVSAAKQAAGAFSGGVKGDLARRYWVRYVAGWMMANSIARFFNGGFYNDEETGRINWSPKKGLKELNQKDPTQQMSFPLPDVDLKIAGVKFNPGRDENGKKLYSHFGKQALEIPRYATDTVDALFAKSNPVIQHLTKQMLSGTPYKGEMFPVQGKYKGGQFKPWGGSRAGTLERGARRVGEAIGEFVPFSLRGLGARGLSTFIASGLGAVPVGKGMSLRKAEPYMYDALRTKNIKKMNQVVNVLKDNKYTDEQIKRTLTRIRKEWMPNQFLTQVAEEQKK